MVIRLGHRSGARALAAAALLLALPGAASAAPPRLTLEDTRPADGAISIATADWKLVYSQFFNGGIHQWFDLSSDPSQRDNISTEQGGGYNQGTLFDYDVYLGLNGNDSVEFMTTLGRNSDPGSLDLRVLENTPTRIRILQAGHPRLNNGAGPPGNPFPELQLVDVRTVWTLYPTGKVAVDFSAQRNPAGETVDRGPGGAGKAVVSTGTPLLDGVGGADFLAVFAFSGDTIESPTGGWGPIRILKRLAPTQLMLESPAPTGTFDYVIRRNNIRLETISIHADGDENLAVQCGAPGVSRWQGGSNTDPLWEDPPITTNGCASQMPNMGNRSDDVLLAHWAKDRPVGSLLVFFEPWTPSNGGFFNDTGFTDISFTQLGRGGIRPFEPIARHFLTQMGSSASQVLPSIRSVADAQPFSDDYRTPFAEAVTGTLASGPGLSSGFDPATAAYRIQAADGVAALRFDASGGSRRAIAYKAPVVEIDGFSVPDTDLVVERSNDGGATFAPLAPDSFVISTRADEAQLGAGRRVFQLLGDIPATATGPTAVVLRFRASN